MLPICKPLSRGEAGRSAEQGHMDIDAAEDG